MFIAVAWIDRQPIRAVVADADAPEIAIACSPVDEEMSAWEPAYAIVRGQKRELPSCFVLHPLAEEALRRIIWLSEGEDGQAVHAESPEVD